MSHEETPSADAPELWRIPTDEALNLVDEHLGAPDDWSASALLEYRLSADFQADWKAEVGHWLHAAKQCGGLNGMLAPILGERARKARNEERNLNDQRHLKLHQHLAAAMVCHYFTGLLWSCVGFDTETGREIDIDLALRTPDGTLVEFQVKAPDRPGRLEGGRYRDGDYDRRVVDALDHAATQLPQPSRGVAMVALFAQRSFSLAGDPSCVITRVFGATMQSEDGVFLRQADFGEFLVGTWNHVAGIAILDMLRGANFVEDDGRVRIVDRVRYPCTVLLNPNAEHPADPDWFPRSRVAVLEGDRFRWIRGEPWDDDGLPTGTKIVSRLPQP